MAIMSRHTSSDPAAPGDSAISEEHLAFLRDDFARLDAFWPGLADSIIEYVVNGQGEEVLDRLVAMPGRGRALDLTGCSLIAGVNRAARARFFASPPAADPLFFLRLARVYDAAAWPDRIVNPNYPSLGLPDWIELFLWEATNSSPYIYSTVEQKIPFRAEVVEQMLLAAGEPGPLLMRAVVMADSRSDSPNRTPPHPLSARFRGDGRAISRSRSKRDSASPRRTGGPTSWNCCSKEKSIPRPLPPESSSWRCAIRRQSARRPNRCWARFRP